MIFHSFFFLNVRKLSPRKLKWGICSGPSCCHAWRWAIKLPPDFFVAKPTNPAHQAVSFSVSCLFCASVLKSRTHMLSCGNNNVLRLCQMHMIAVTKSRGTITLHHVWLPKWPPPHSINTGVKWRPDSLFSIPWLSHAHFMIFKLFQCHRSFDYNQIASVPPESFKHLKSLRMLMLDYNNLSTIPIKALGKCTNLQKLRLGSNHISDIPGYAFQNNSHLEYL